MERHFLQVDSGQGYFPPFIRGFGAFVLFQSGYLPRPGGHFPSSLAAVGAVPWPTDEALSVPFQAGLATAAARPNTRPQSARDRKSVV